MSNKEIWLSYENLKFKGWIFSSLGDNFRNKSVFVSDKSTIDTAPHTTSKNQNSFEFMHRTGDLRISLFCESYDNIFWVYISIQISMRARILLRSSLWYHKEDRIKQMRSGEKWMVVKKFIEKFYALHDHGHDWSNSQWLH